jgi:hypothetical protein
MVEQHSAHARDRDSFLCVTNLEASQNTMGIDTKLIESLDKPLFGVIPKISAITSIIIKSHDNYCA